MSSPEGDLYRPDPADLEPDPVIRERLVIGQQLDWIHHEVYLCDRNETDFYVVSKGVKIPPELQDKLLNDGESVDVLSRAFEYAGIPLPDNLFSPEAGALIVDTLRPYEANQYEQMRLLLARLSELDPSRVDVEIE